MVDILIDHGYVVYETYDGKVEVLMPLPKREPQTFVLQQQLKIPTGPLDNIVIDAGSVVNVDTEGVVTIMSGHQFDKKKFPGIGSLSPEAKAEKAKWNTWDLLDKPHTEVGLNPNELALSTPMPKKNIGIGFLGMVSKLALFGKNPCGEVVLEPPHVDMITKTQQEHIDYLKQHVAAAFAVPSDLLFEPKPGMAVDSMTVTPMKLKFLDFEGQTVPPAPKEKEVAKKATTKKKPAPKAEAVFGWVFESSTEVQGTKAKYSTVLRTDQSITCNCPGWIFKKKGETVRACKHTRNVEEEAKGIFKKWKKGEPLPTIEDTIKLDNVPGVTRKGTATKIGYSRTLDE